MKEKTTKHKRSEDKSDSRKFECQICGRSYKNKATLKAHKIYHEPPQFECYLCHRKFFLKTAMKNHILKNRCNSTWPGRKSGLFIENRISSTKTSSLQTQNKENSTKEVTNNQNLSKLPSTDDPQKTNEKQKISLENSTLPEMNAINQNIRSGSFEQDILSQIGNMIDTIESQEKNSEEVIMGQFSLSRVWNIS